MAWDLRAECLQPSARTTVRQTSLLFQQTVYRTSLGLIRGVFYLTEMFEILNGDELRSLSICTVQREKNRSRGGASCLQIFNHHTANRVQLYCQSTSHTKMQQKVYKLNSATQNLCVLFECTCIICVLVSCHQFPVMLTFVGSNGVPLNGEPSAFQAFFKISWAFWKKKIYNSWHYHHIT